MMNNNFVILLVGASGSGKTTVAEILNDEYGFKSVESYTERPKRYECEKGHTFVTKEEFDEVVNDACAYTVFNGYRYCATNAQVDKSQIYIIDPIGIEYFNKLYKGDKCVVSVFLNVPEKTRYQRMRARGDSRLSAIKRLIHDRKMFKNCKCDIIINGMSSPQTVANKLFNAVALYLVVQSGEEGDINKSANNRY